MDFKKIEHIQNEINFRGKELYNLIIKYFRYEYTEFDCYLIFLNLKETSYHNRIRFINDNLKKNPLEFLKHIFDKLILVHKFGLSRLIDEDTDLSWSRRLKRIKTESYSSKVIRENKSNSFESFNNKFDDLLRVILKAEGDNIIYKRLVKKRLIFSHVFNYPIDIPEERKYYYKQTKLKLIQGVIQFYLFKIEKHAVCSVCFESFAVLEKKNISTLIYTLCGHTICQSCDKSILVKTCHICRMSSKIRSLITINNSICAGFCYNPLYKCESFLLAECGHIYCTHCINEMVIDSIPLLSFIHRKSLYSSNNQKHNDVKCRICNDFLNKWCKIYLEFQ